MNNQFLLDTLVLTLQHYKIVVGGWELAHQNLQCGNLPDCPDLFPRLFEPVQEQLNKVM